METLQIVWTFICANWELISGALVAIVAVVNAATRHWSGHAGLMRALMLLVELLSLLRSKDAPRGVAGPLKLPVQSVPPDPPPVIDEARERKDEIVRRCRESREKMRLPSILLALALPALLSGCGTLDQLGRIQQAGAAVRKAATPVVDARCEAAAATCPKGPAEQCAALMECWAKRRALYAATDAVQLIVAAGLAANAAGEDGGAFVDKAVAALKRVYELVTSYRLLDGLNEVLK